MSFDSLTTIWVAIIGLFGTIVVAVISGFFMLKSVQKTTPSHRYLEEMQGQKIAQEIIDNYQKVQAEEREKIKNLQEKVEHLMELLEEPEYEIITITKGGVEPVILSSKVRLVNTALDNYP